MLSTKSEPKHLFSYFKKPIQNTIPDHSSTLLKIYNSIVNDTFKTQTAELRAISNSIDTKKYKSSRFDYVTFSGIFSKRSNQHLKQHSGLLVLDFDHIENVDDLRSLLLHDNLHETELLFTSPSGYGIKWVVAIDLNTVSHEKYFTGIRNYIRHTYAIEIDKSGKDMARACFLCHDPYAYINPKHLV